MIFRSTPAPFILVGVAHILAGWPLFKFAAETLLGIGTAPFGFLFLPVGIAFLLLPALLLIGTGLALILWLRWGPFTAMLLDGIVLVGSLVTGLQGVPRMLV
ncbi:MAG TPA: hypothetical protein VM370_03685, partial [Candidatus Thermoplasmatota archaeon]|nr:hypothetical protein [Candidatus Thermoplasmatota archaeon]